MKEACNLKVPFESPSLNNYFILKIFNLSGKMPEIKEEFLRWLKGVFKYSAAILILGDIAGKLKEKNTIVKSVVLYFC